MTKLLESLLLEGFDESYLDEYGYYHCKCSQCVATFINGIACHESGCPNSFKQDDFDDELYQDDFVEDYDD